MVETVEGSVEPKPIELFLLVAIGKLGLSTLYELKQAAGLEPGSIRGSIARLEAWGLLARSEHREKHGARPMELTEDGSRCIAEHWEKSLLPGQEIESVLRGATVAMAMARPIVTSEFLARAASDRQRYRGPMELDTSLLKKGALEFHAEAREFYSWQRRAFEAWLLHELASKLAAANADAASGRSSEQSSAKQS